MEQKIFGVALGLMFEAGYYYNYVNYVYYKYFFPHLSSYVLDGLPP